MNHAGPPARSSHAAPVQDLSFVVGQDHRGHWLAVETHGHGGGIFCNRQAAMRYAAFESGWRPNAVKLVGPKVLLAL